MIRRSLLLGGISLGLLPAGADAQTVLSVDYLRSLSGTIGVYARTMGDGPPILAYNDGVPFPTASTIKLVIMTAVFRALDDGTLKVDTPIPIGAGDMVGGSETFAAVRPKTAFPLMRVVYAMIRQSDNTASNALISYLGFPTINAAAQAAGMTATRLRRHFLDYKAIVAHNENVSTPRDMAALLYSIERGAREGLDTIVSYHSCRWMIEILLGQEDRTKIPRGLPRGTHVANKTGEIDGVRSDVAIVEPFGETPYVIAVMTKELRDYGAGLAAIAKIARDVDRAVKAASASD